jgi:uncharacterized protein YjbI with pentapeptide repeats
MDTFLLWTVPVVALVALALIYFIPRRLVPPPSSSRREEIVEVITARNDIRKTYAQLLAGASFVITFLLSIYNFNRDFTQKAKQASAEQFSKAIAQVTAKIDDSWASAGAFQVLSEIARQNTYYHTAVLRTMAQYLATTSRAACKDGADSDSKYLMPPSIQLVARIFADHDASNDYRWKPLNLEGACLSRVSWLDPVGTKNLYMPGARLIGADLRNAKLGSSNMDGVVGGLDQVTDWWNLHSVQITSWKDVDTIQSSSRKWHWANFSQADLADVHAGEAKLLGALFVEAHLDRSFWQNADLRYTNFYQARLGQHHETHSALDSHVQNPPMGSLKRLPCRRPPSNQL